MNPFAFARPKSFEQAAELLTNHAYSLPVIKAGGMDVLDRCKEGITQPDLLVDVRPLRWRGAAEAIAMLATDADSTTISIGATTTLAQIAASPLIREHAPALAQAAGDAASPQIRNVATIAGNLLQRPRCWYYRNQQFNCLKKGGHHCFAVDGEHRYHAIFGDGPCYMVHPSSLAPVLYVLNGAVHVVGDDRESVPVNRLYHTPDHGILDEHNLRPGEVITHITLRRSAHSGFYAIKEREMFDWPLAMAAVGLELDGNTIVSASVCAGAVAPVPWPLPRVEHALRGVRVNDDRALRDACSIAGEGAQPLAENGYKARLVTVAVRRAVVRAAGLDVEAPS